METLHLLKNMIQSRTLELGEGDGVTGGLTVGYIDQCGQALIAVIMLMLIIFIMAFGLMTSTINLTTTNQGDVYLHGAQSASQAGLAYFGSLMNSMGGNFINCKDPGTTGSPLPSCISSTSSYSFAVQGSGGSNGWERFTLSLVFPNCKFKNSKLNPPSVVACTTTADCQTAVTQGYISTCSYEIVSVGCMVASSTSTTCLNSVTSTTTQSYNISGNSFLNYAFYNNYSADDPGDAASFGNVATSSGGFTQYTETASQEQYAQSNCAFYMWSKKGYLGNSSPNGTGYGPNYGAYTGPNGNTRYCPFTYQDYGQTFTGAVYSTDIMWDCGTSFNGPVTTGDPISGTKSINQNMNSGGFNGAWGGTYYGFNLGSPYWDEYPAGCNSQPTFTNNGVNCNSNCIKQVPAMSPPPALSQLQGEAQSGGCEFFGPTVVDLLQGGKMAVYSPDTTSALANSVTGSGYSTYGHSYVSGTNTVWPCGVPADATASTNVSLGGGCNMTGGLAAPLSSSGIPQCIVDVPDPSTTNGNSIFANGAVYVANVPSTPYSTFCPQVEGEINSPGESSYGCTFTKTTVQKCGYNRWGQWVCRNVTTYVPNGERQGDLLIQSGNGQSNSSNTGFDAFATFGSDANIILTGSLIYANSANKANPATNNYAYWDSNNPQLSDSLGLAATKFVEINLPADSGYFDYGTGNGAGGAHQNYILDAAILCAQHSFGVANIYQGNGSQNDGNLEGTVYVNGSIATNFTLNNCWVGYSGYCGYSTTYDQSFSNTENQPPAFPTPVIAPSQYVEG